MTPPPSRILYVGDLSPGGTCLQRLTVLQDLGFQVVAIDFSYPPSIGGVRRFLDRVISKLYRLGWHRLTLPDWAGLNRKIVNCAKGDPCRVLWIDKGLRINRNTFKQIKSAFPEMVVIGYSVDNMLERHNNSRQFIESLPFYDLYATTKSFAVPEMTRLGCKKVQFVPNAFDRNVHRPPKTQESAPYPLAGRVGFVGTWERAREQSIVYLARNGIPVTIFGNDWPARVAAEKNIDIRYEAIYGASYANALHAFAINLCFLRKINFDLQTQRSVEIPACGGFMLAERTEEHRQLFKEGAEADFFSDDEELLKKVRHYLDHPEERKRIALAGRERCMSSDYSYHGQLRGILASAGVPLPENIQPAP